MQSPDILDVPAKQTEANRLLFLLLVGVFLVVVVVVVGVGGAGDEHRKRTFATLMHAATEERTDSARCPFITECAATERQLELFVEPAFLC